MGWGDTLLRVPDGPGWVCPVGTIEGGAVPGIQHLPVSVFGQPPLDDAEQAAFLLGGTHAVLELRAARVLAAIASLGA